MTLVESDNFLAMRERCIIRAKTSSFNKMCITRHSFKHHSVIILPLLSFTY